MRKHSGATPSITSEKIIHDRLGENPCMQTKIETWQKCPQLLSRALGEALNTEFRDMDEGILL